MRDSAYLLAYGPPDVRPAMTATQGRLADTIDVFYSAADKASESAMAAHAYKRAVDDLDTGVARELVRPLYCRAAMPR